MTNKLLQKVESKTGVRREGGRGVKLKRLFHACNGCYVATI